MRISGRRQVGLSLIEVLVALVIGAIVIAGVYRTFTVQQKSFIVQEQVSEAQQSVRAVMDLIARDIRMSGFGRPDWNVCTFAGSVNITSPTNFTVVGALGPPIALLGDDASMGTNTLTLDRDVTVTEGDDGTEDNLFIFEPDTPPIPADGLRYATVRVTDGAPSSQITGKIIPIDDTGPERLQVDLRGTAPDQALVYRVECVNYALNGTDLERNNEVLASNVTGFQITDFSDPAVPETLGKYEVSITVRTRTNDPDWPQDGGFRTRTLTSTIKARNLSDSS